MIDRARAGSETASAVRSCEVLLAANHGAVERACNRFSAGLLIPDEVVTWLADWGMLSIEDLRATARQWAVSLPALAWHVLETANGDGGLVSLRWWRPEARGRKSRLVVEWSVFPKARELFLKPGIVVVSTPVLREMLACHEERLFTDATLPLPGFQTGRDVRALTTEKGVHLLVSPARQHMAARASAVWTGP